MVVSVRENVNKLLTKFYDFMNTVDCQNAQNPLNVIDYI